MSKSFVVGITGGSESGKTHFLNQLMEKFLRIKSAYFSQDNYYKKRHEQKKDDKGFENFDSPTAIRRDKFESDLIKID